MDIVHTITLITVSNTLQLNLSTPASDSSAVTHISLATILLITLIGWHGASYLSENAGIVGGPGAVPQQLTVTQGAERFESLRLSLP